MLDFHSYSVMLNKKIRRNFRIFFLSGSTCELASLVVYVEGFFQIRLSEFSEWLNATKMLWFICLVTGNLESNWIYCSILLGEFILTLYFFLSMQKSIKRVPRQGNIDRHLYTSSTRGQTTRILFVSIISWSKICLESIKTCQILESHGDSYSRYLHEPLFSVRFLQESTYVRLYHI